MVSGKSFTQIISCLRAADDTGLRARCMIHRNDGDSGLRTRDSSGPKSQREVRTCQLASECPAASPTGRKDDPTSSIWWNLEHRVTHKGRNRNDRWARHGINRCQDVRRCDQDTTDSKFAFPHDEYLQGMVRSAYSHFVSGSPRREFRRVSQ